MRKLGAIARASRRCRSTTTWSTRTTSSTRVLDQRRSREIAAAGRRSFEWATPIRSRQSARRASFRRGQSVHDPGRADRCSAVAKRIRTARGPSSPSRRARCGIRRGGISRLARWRTAVARRWPVDVAFVLGSSRADTARRAVSTADARVVLLVELVESARASSATSSIEHGVEASASSAPPPRGVRGWLQPIGIDRPSGRLIGVSGLGWA